MNVALGKFTAGGGVQKTFNQQNKNVKNKLKIIYTTSKVSPHPIACHPRVSDDLVNKISQAFINIGNDKNKRKLLSNIPMKKIGKASLSDYEELKIMGLQKYYKEK